MSWLSWLAGLTEERGRRESRREEEEGGRKEDEGGGGRKRQEGRERRKEGGSGHALYVSFWLCRRVLCRVRGRNHFQPFSRGQIQNKLPPRTVRDGNTARN